MPVCSACVRARAQLWGFCDGCRAWRSTRFPFLLLTTSCFCDCVVVLSACVQRSCSRAALVLPFTRVLLAWSFVRVLRGGVSLGCCLFFVFAHARGAICPAVCLRHPSMSLYSAISCTMRSDMLLVLTAWGGGAAVVVVAVVVALPRGGPHHLQDMVQHTHMLTNGDTTHTRHTHTGNTTSLSSIARSIPKKVLLLLLPALGPSAAAASGAPLGPMTSVPRSTCHGWGGRRRPGEGEAEGVCVATLSWRSHPILSARLAVYLALAPARLLACRRARITSK